MLSVVIPAYNEQDAIIGTVREIRSVLEAAGETDFEILVVDDGSTDATAARAEEAGARVVRKVQNIGYGHSLKVGIRAALNDTIVITDGDLTYPADQIPELLAIYRSGWNMVVGQRTGEHYRESAVKSPLRSILKWLVEFVAGRQIPDVNSGMRVFSRKDIEVYFPHLSDTFSFTTSATLVYMLERKSVHYKEIPYLKREGTTKVRLFRDSLRTLQYIVQTILFYNPLKAFLALCLIPGIFSAVLLASGLMFGSMSLAGLGIQALFTVFVIFAIGMLAEMIRQTGLRGDEEC